MLQKPPPTKRPGGGPKVTPAETSKAAANIVSVSPVLPFGEPGRGGAGGRKKGARGGSQGGGPSRCRQTCFVSLLHRRVSVRTWPVEAVHVSIPSLSPPISTTPDRLPSLPPCLALFTSSCPDAYCPRPRPPNSQRRRPAPPGALPPRATRRRCTRRRTAATPPSPQTRRKGIDVSGRAAPGGPLSLETVRGWRFRQRREFSRAGRLVPTPAGWPPGPRFCSSHAPLSPPSPAPPPFPTPRRGQGRRRVLIPRALRLSGGAAPADGDPQLLLPARGAGGRGVTGAARTPM